ncbi:MAG: hypothetical protein NTV70_08255 [Acidobacteria bacterium]|nr:hypothetical protein [Acidobacteriota bacterium]
MLSVLEPDIRAALTAMLASRAFASATRSRRFLQYVVEETLAGRQAHIKEYTLGEAVFDRTADFDPKADPIVRVEAVKLRARLAEYEAEAAPGTLRIALPKGAYVPTFEWRPAPADTATAETPTAAAALDAPSPSIPTAATPTSGRWRRRWLWEALVAVTLAAGGIAFWRGLPWRSPPLTSVVILPFENLTGDPHEDYLGLGLTEELTDALTRSGGLRVVSRTSAFSFQGKSLDVKQIGARLGVAAVVEGSVRRSGDRIRVTAQLIQVADGFHRWSQTFDRQITDSISLQSDLAQAIAANLRVPLSGEQEQRLTRQYTANPEAFTLYLKGKQELGRMSPGGLDRARELYRRSLAIDPNYPLPKIGLAVTCLMQGMFGLQAPAASMECARRYASEALVADPSLSEARAVLASVRGRYDWDWAGAEADFRLALASGPSAAAHNAFASNVLLPQAKFEEAIREARLAQQMDPLSLSFAAGVPWLWIFSGDADKAIAEFRRLGAGEPGSGAMALGLALAHAFRQELKEAIQVLEAAPPDGPVIAHLAVLYAQSGRIPDARRILARMQQQSKTSYVSPLTFFLMYAALDEAGPAEAALEQALADHDLNLIYARFDFGFHFLGQNPRYAAMLHRVRQRMNLSDLLESKH